MPEPRWTDLEALRWEARRNMEARSAIAKEEIKRRRFWAGVFAILECACVIAILWGMFWIWTKIQ